MKIIVLVKQVPDTWSHRALDMATGQLDRSASDAVPDEINERTMEVALQYKDDHPKTEVVAVSMGTEDTTNTLRKMLSMGADSAVLVSDPELASSDAVLTARVLAAVLEKIGGHLVLAGDQSTDGKGGVVPAMIAELRNLALVPSADTLQITDGAITGELQIDGGARTVTAELPAVASLTEKCADPRFPNFKNVISAKKKPSMLWSLADLGAQLGWEDARAQSVMVSARERPEKQAGPKVIDDGTAAGQLAEFLAVNRLL